MEKKLCKNVPHGLTCDRISVAATGAAASEARRAHTHTHTQSNTRVTEDRTELDAETSLTGADGRSRAKRRSRGGDD